MRIKKIKGLISFEIKREKKIKRFRVDKVFMVAGTNENTSSWQTC